MEEPVLSLQSVVVVRDGRKILGPVTWEVHADEHWVILGPNGGGKSTMMAVAAMTTHPTEGRVRLLGHELGHTDVRALRSRVGLASAGLVDQLRPQLMAVDVVLCGLYGALEPWWHHYGGEDRRRAQSLLADLGLSGYGQRTFGTLSSGERQRVLLARTLMNEPSLVILDEPNAGLDMGGRESLIQALDSLAELGPASVLVTHHVEDIPSSTTHLLALADSRAVAAGPIERTLTAELLSDVFGLDVMLTRHDGRYAARARNR
jgi:iron complex transport system ATP-binding protein